MILRICLYIFLCATGVVAWGQNLEAQLKSFDLSLIDDVPRLQTAIEKNDCQSVLTTPYCKFLAENGRASECPSLLSGVRHDQLSGAYTLFGFEFDVREFEAMNWLEMNSLSEEEAMPEICFLSNVWRPLEPWYVDTGKNFDGVRRENYLCAAGLCN